MKIIKFSKVGFNYTIQYNTDENNIGPNILKGSSLNTFAK